METIDKCWQDYRQIINENPFLSREEELKLATIVKKIKSGKIRQEARERLFKSNLRLVLKVAHSYNRTGSNQDFLDLVNAGSEGLLIAIDRFDPKKYKTRLTTYSLPWIQLKVMTHINENSRTVYIPAFLVDKARKYKKLLRNIGEDNDKNLTDDELMEKLSLTERGLRNLRLSQSLTVHMDANINFHKNSGSCGGDNGASENGASIKDYLADTSPKPDEILLAKENKSDILDAVKELNKVERDIIGSRYLMGEKLNLSVIGKRHGCSGERVRQIEIIALKKLRWKLKNKFDFKNKVRPVYVGTK